MSKTPQQIRESKQRLVSVGRDIESLTDDSRFKYLLERIQEKVVETKEAVLASNSWEEFVHNKAYLKGLSALQVEIDTIISRGKNAERTLKT